MIFVLRRKEIQEHLVREELMFKEELIMLNDKKHMLEHQLEKEHYRLNAEDPSAFDDSKLQSINHELRRLKLHEREIRERLIQNKERHLRRDMEISERKKRKKTHNK